MGREQANNVHEQWMFSQCAVIPHEVDPDKEAPPRSKCGAKYGAHPFFLPIYMHTASIRHTANRATVI